MVPRENRLAQNWGETKHNPNANAGQTGSRAASTAHFHNLIAEWRTIRRLTLAEAATMLCCSAATFRRWEAGRLMPRGFTLRAIVAAIEGGLI